MAMAEFEFAAPGTDHPKYSDDHEFVVFVNGESACVLAPGQSLEIRRLRNSEPVDAAWLVQAISAKLKHDGYIRSGDDLDVLIQEFSASRSPTPSK